MAPVTSLRLCLWSVLTASCSATWVNWTRYDHMDRFVARRTHDGTIHFGDCPTCTPTALDGSWVQDAIPHSHDHVHGNKHPHKHPHLHIQTHVHGHVDTDPSWAMEDRCMKVNGSKWYSHMWNMTEYTNRILISQERLRYQPQITYSIQDLLGNISIHADTGSPNQGTLDITYHSVDHRFAPPILKTCIRPNTAEIGSALDVCEETDIAAYGPLLNSEYAPMSGRNAAVSQICRWQVAGTKLYLACRNGLGGSGRRRTALWADCVPTAPDTATERISEVDCISQPITFEKQSADSCRSSLARLLSPSSASRMSVAAFTGLWLVPIVLFKQ